MRGLRKQYHLQLNPKLGHGKCAILWIPCAYIACTTMLDNPWARKVYHNKQPHYQPVIDCTYWPMLDAFNNWNITQLTNKTTSSENFDAVHKVVLYGTGDNMASLVHWCKYGAISSVDLTTTGQYVIKYLSEPYKLQENQTMYAKVINACALVVKAEYLSIMKSKTIGIGNRREQISIS